MKKFSKILAAQVCAIAFLACPLAKASIITQDSGSFLDTQTGYLWRTLGQYAGMDYLSAVKALPTGYHVASEAELARLSKDVGADPDTFYDDAAVIGAKFDPDNAMIWGFYGDGSRYLWKTDWEDFWTSNTSSAASTGWANNTSGLVAAGYHDPYLSIFAVDTAASQAAVPEPATLALVGLGLAGLARRRRSGGR